MQTAEELKQAYDQLDRNWNYVHSAAMTPIRNALGKPEGTVPELIAAIHDLQLHNRRLIAACKYAVQFDNSQICQTLKKRLVGALKNEQG
jgi:hypothetical protein